MTATLYGIKACDTVAKARAWLADRGFGGYVRTPERIEPDAAGDRAAEHGRWTADWKDAPPQSGPYLAVWRRVTGQWMIESETFVTTG